MNTSNKPRVVTAFEKLSKDVQQQIKLEYPEGFSQHLIKFSDKEGKLISALRYEGEDKIYLVKMSVMVAEQLIEDDEDYDDEGNLTEDAREEYEDEEVEED